ncbi:glycosyltransferase [uncultured Cetobacterium sp.]|uniref:glycosyltransferase n=1 Tax=uncultured Cetobacterium sp. TaxID=527638 RepID=UPI0025E3C549|nr:glycosyltransferase [uncultured Cetobacterium sp.]
MVKKILIIIETLNGGGAEKVLLDILKKLDTKKYSVDIFLLNKEGIYLKEVSERVNSLKGLAPRNRTYDKNILFRKINSLYLKIRDMFFINGYLCKIKNDYDIEIAFLEGKSTQYISNRKNKAEKIAWVHTDLEKHRMLSKSLERECYSRIDQVISVSKDSKKSVLKLYPELESKTKVIYNPIPKSDIREKANEEVVTNKKLTLVTAGRLTDAKGYDILLKAHKQLLDEGLNYNLQILGEGGLRSEFEKYISENNLTQNTELLGFKRNPYPYIKAADLFVVSSRFEGFSLVLAEAIVLEKPIISTKCVGPLEILDNGKYGELVETEDVDSLANAMRKLILDKQKRQEYKRLAKERSSFFDDEKIMREIEDLLDDKK